MHKIIYIFLITLILVSGGCNKTEVEQYGKAGEAFIMPSVAKNPYLVDMPIIGLGDSFTGECTKFLINWKLAFDEQLISDLKNDQQLKRTEKELRKIHAKIKENEIIAEKYICEAVLTQLLETKAHLEDKLYLISTPKKTSDIFSYKDINDGSFLAEQSKICLSL